MLQSDLEFLRFVYDRSIVGKWSDITGNHHGATTLGIDGIALETEYCKDLGIKQMVAAAQVPGFEFEADVFYVMARTGETINNIAKWIANGRGDDVNILANTEPKKKKGSSGMPHKDAKNGNPVDEEQNMSVRNGMQGMMMTALANCEMPYARNLAESANTRINLDYGFKFLDQGIRKLANRVFWLKLNEKRALDRVKRSYGVVTSPQLITYLTDPRKVKEPMPRSVAHDLLGQAATEAWEKETQYVEVLLRRPEITSRIDEATLRRLADPAQYVGESKSIIRNISERYHGKKTLAA